MSRCPCGGKSCKRCKDKVVTANKRLFAHRVWLKIKAEGRSSIKPRPSKA